MSSSRSESSTAPLPALSPGSGFASAERGRHALTPLAISTRPGRGPGGDATWAPRCAPPAPGEAERGTGDTRAAACRVFAVMGWKVVGSRNHPRDGQRAPLPVW